MTVDGLSARRGTPAPCRRGQSCVGALPAPTWRRPLPQWASRISFTTSPPKEAEDTAVSRSPCPTPPTGPMLDLPTEAGGQQPAASGRNQPSCARGDPRPVPQPGHPKSSHSCGTGHAWPSTMCGWLGPGVAWVTTSTEVLPAWALTLGAPGDVKAVWVRGAQPDDSEG